MRRLLLTVVAGAFLMLPVAGSEPATSAMPTNQDIQNILQQRIDTFHKGVGIVVGVIDPKGRRVVAYGSSGKGGPRPLDGGTVFEIGSVTKVFTSLLLMDMVQRGEVSLTDPVAKFLPADVTVPQRGGKVITLQDLSNQTSGLPRMPDNFTPKDPANPYADYSLKQLFAFLSTYRLTREIGSKYEYSNLGVGLLGQALSRRSGTDFETLVRTRICKPLGMKNTGIALSPSMKARLATGHDGNLAPVANWDLTTLAGAGALRSDADDMLTFLAANLGYTDSELASALASMRAPRTPAGMPRVSIALGWHVLDADGKELFWHNGRTGGYQSFIGFDLKARTGVVVLANASRDEGIDDIGFHLLDARQPLMAAPKEHKEIPQDPKRMEAFTGNYELAPNFVLSVTREGDALFAQATGQPKFQIFPEAERRYFLKVVEAQITFQPDVNGKASGLVLHQDGRDMPAKRLSEAQPSTTPARKEVHVDPSLFDQYVGRYALSPAFILTITREGDHLFAQATNQPKFELFAESSKAFFLKVVDAQITFDTDAEGKALGLTLHQGGAHMPAKRLGD